MGNEPRNARLNRLIGNGSWCAEKNLTGEYLQIALKDSKMITGISTQGIHHKDGKWVTEYALYYRDKEGSTFQPYTVDGFTKVLTVCLLSCMVSSKTLAWCCSLRLTL